MICVFVDERLEKWKMRRDPEYGLEPAYHAFCWLRFKYRPSIRVDETEVKEQSMQLNSFLNLLLQVHMKSLRVISVYVPKGAVAYMERRLAKIEGDKK